MKQDAKEDNFDRNIRQRQNETSNSLDQLENAAKIIQQSVA